MINLETQKMYLRAKVHRDCDEIKSLRGTKAIGLKCLNGNNLVYENRDTFKSLLDDTEEIEITTWSSLVRNAIDVLKKPIMYVMKDVGSEEFLTIFDNNVKEICEEAGFRLNTNCPKRLFKEAEETDLIKSTVYLSNKNHMIEVFKDEDGISWYLCAVYTVEIIVMLEALLDTIYDMAEEYTVYKEKINNFQHYTFELSYKEREKNLYDTEHFIVDDVELAKGAELHRFINRAGVPYSEIYLDGEPKGSCERQFEEDMISWWNDPNEYYRKSEDKRGKEKTRMSVDLEKVDEELKVLEMSKEIIKMQGAISKINSLTMELLENTMEFQKKYNLKNLDEILGYKN